jgi:hypothetical protein
VDGSGHHVDAWIKLQVRNILLTAASNRSAEDGLTVCRRLRLNIQLITAYCQHVASMVPVLCCTSRFSTIRLDFRIPTSFHFATNQFRLIAPTRHTRVSVGISMNYNQSKSKSETPRICLPFISNVGNELSLPHSLRARTSLSLSNARHRPRIWNTSQYINPFPTRG